MDVENMMKLRTLSWGAYSGFSKWAQSNHMDFFFFFFTSIHSFCFPLSLPSFKHSMATSKAHTLVYLLTDD